MVIWVPGTGRCVCKRCNFFLGDTFSDIKYISKPLKWFIHWSSNSIAPFLRMHLRKASEMCTNACMQGWCAFQCLACLLSDSCPPVLSCSKLKKKKTHISLTLLSLGFWVVFTMGGTGRNQEIRGWENRRYISTLSAFCGLTRSSSVFSVFQLPADRKLFLCFQHFPSSACQSSHSY